MHGHDALDGLGGAWPCLGIVPPAPDPEVRVLDRDVLAPYLLPSQKVNADVMIVDRDYYSLEPLAFVITRVDLLPML
jgi:hypothetical protein